MINPVIQIETEVVLLQETGNDADDAKVLSFGEVEVAHVTVPWEHVARLPLLEKVYAADVVAVYENELVFADDGGLEQGADPGDECEGLLVEELELAEGALEHEEGYFDLEVVGQVLDELDELLDVVLVLVADGGLDVLV